MTYPTIKRHWTTEHENYNDYQYGAIPIDLEELLKALAYQRDVRNNIPPDSRISKGAIKETRELYAGDKLDAYRYYSRTPNSTISVGIRYGNSGAEYVSPDLSYEIASKFDLDPMNRDNPIPVYEKLTESKVKKLEQEKEKYEEIFNTLYSCDKSGDNMENFKGDTLQERIDRLIQIKNAWVQIHRLESAIENDGQPNKYIDNYIGDDEDIIQFIQQLASYIPKETLNKKI